MADDKKIIFSMVGVSKSFQNNKQVLKDIYLDVHTLGMVLGISNKLGFHASRHTFGVLMLNEDIPIGSIAKMMGHADITSTNVF